MNDSLRRQRGMDFDRGHIRAESFLHDANFIQAKGQPARRKLSRFTCDQGILVFVCIAPQPHRHFRGEPLWIKHLQAQFAGIRLRLQQRGDERKGQKPKDSRAHSLKSYRSASRIRSGSLAMIANSITSRFVELSTPRRYTCWMHSHQRSAQRRRQVYPAIHGTTVLCVRKDSKVVLVADGQVTMGDHVIKQGARKSRRLYNDKVVAGFAGSTADAISLFERFEGKLQEFSGNLQKAAVELAKEWRKDRALRHLEALLIVADAKSTLILSGNGDVIEPDDGLVAIGSGGPYALSAARALLKHSKLNAKDLAMEAMRIASEICIYTNANFTVEEL